MNFLTNTCILLAAFIVAAFIQEAQSDEDIIKIPFSGYGKGKVPEFFKSRYDVNVVANDDNNEESGALQQAGRGLLSHVSKGTIKEKPKSKKKNKRKKVKNMSSTELAEQTKKNYRAAKNKGREMSLNFGFSKYGNEEAYGNVHEGSNYKKPSLNQNTNTKNDNGGPNAPTGTEKGPNQQDNNSLGNNPNERNDNANRPTGNASNGNNNNNENNDNGSNGNNPNGNNNVGRQPGDNNPAENKPEESNTSTGNQPVVQNEQTPNRDEPITSQGEPTANGNNPPENTNAANQKETSPSNQNDGPRNGGDDGTTILNSNGGPPNNDLQNSGNNNPDNQNQNNLNPSNQNQNNFNPSNQDQNNLNPSNQNQNNFNPSNQDQNNFNPANQNQNNFNPANQNQNNFNPSNQNRNNDDDSNNNRLNPLNMFKGSNSMNFGFSSYGMKKFFGGQNHEGYKNYNRHQDSRSFRNNDNDDNSNLDETNSNMQTGGRQQNVDAMPFYGMMNFGFSNYGKRKASGRVMAKKSKALSRQLGKMVGVIDIPREEEKIKSKSYSPEGIPFGFTVESFAIFQRGIKN